jgi:hypothetical protein
MHNILINNSQNMEVSQTTIDPVVMSIIEEYLGENQRRNPNDEDEDEDVVLAALAILAEDDRESRGIKAAEEQQQQQINGAAVVGGLAGLVLAGPVMGVLAAGGVALTAARNHGRAGELARATGDALLDVGGQMRSSSLVKITADTFFQSFEWTSENRRKVEPSLIISDE